MQIITLLWLAIITLGSQSDVVILSSQQLADLQLKVILEGPFDPSTGKMSSRLYELGYLPGMQPKTFFGTSTPLENPYQAWEGEKQQSEAFLNYKYREGAVDWIYVLIKDAKGVSVFQSVAMLYEDGNVDIINKPSLSTEHSYQVVVIHRNHLPIESPKITVTESHVLTYDFTDVNQKEGKKSSGVNMLYAGQLQEESLSQISISQEDIEVWRKFIGQNSAYLDADVNLDGDVSFEDQSVILSNLNATAKIILR